MFNEAAFEQLKRHSLAQGLSDGELRDFAAICEWLSSAPKSPIVREGEPGTAFYFVLEGNVKVVRRVDDDQEAVLGALGAGDFFGEMSIVEQYRHSASVIAVTSTVCLVVPRDNFNRFAEANPAVAFKVLRHVLRGVCTRLSISSANICDFLFVS